MKTFRTAIWLVAAAVVFAACGGSSADDPATTTTLDAGVPAFVERMAAIDEAVAAWRTALTLPVAQEAAEAAANLIVGSNGPGYGDRNGDGVVSGATVAGVLPGLDGMPTGLAAPLAGNDCIGADVLGGGWNDPEARWGEMLDAIDAWRPGNNTMPTLASHPMRVVGWATFTLDTGSLDEAHEYAGHAKLHVDISVRALDC